MQAEFSSSINVSLFTASGTNSFSKSLISFSRLSLLISPCSATICDGIFERIVENSCETFEVSQKFGSRIRVYSHSIPLSSWSPAQRSFFSSGDNGSKVVLIIQYFWWVQKKNEEATTHMIFPVSNPGLMHPLIKLALALALALVAVPLLLLE